MAGWTATQIKSFRKEVVQHWGCGWARLGPQQQEAELCKQACSVICACDRHSTASLQDVAAMVRGLCWPAIAEAEPKQ